MKHKHLSIYLSIALLLSGCAKVEEVIDHLTEDDPRVVLTHKELAQRNSFTITFEPNTDAVSYEYAYTIGGSRESFVEGTMSGIVEVDNVVKADIEFTDLNPQTTYTVYARAFGKDGKAGPVASIMVKTMPNWAEAADLEASLSYRTNNSAGFKILGTLAFYKFEFAIGKASDKKAFENGTLSGIRERNEAEEYTANFFDLEPATDYVFFYRAYDRNNTPTEVFEIPVTTNAAGAGPEVAFEVKNIDAYVGEFTFTGNSHLDSYRYSVSTAVGGSFDTALEDVFGAKGNAQIVLENFELSGTSFTGVGVTPTDFTNYTPPSDAYGVLASYYLPVLEAGLEFYAYIGMYDIEGNYLGTQRYKYSTPAYDENLPAATVTATATAITAKGATIKFTVGAGTLGFFFDTIDADVYDYAIANNLWGDEVSGYQPYHENFLRDSFFKRPDSQQGIWWRYYKDPSDYLDETMSPGQKFRIAICPMNHNGVSDPDWGKLWVSDVYTAATE